MEWKKVKFEELENQELYKILQLRNKVFVVEQNCIYQDADDNDEKAIHIFLKNKNEIVTYLRILKPCNYFENASIGRVVTNPKYRNKSFAKKAIRMAIKHIFNEWNQNQIEISAQTYLIEYYKKLGFETKGNEYLEDGIPHIRMIYKK